MTENPYQPAETESLSADKKTPYAFYAAMIVFLAGVLLNYFTATRWYAELHATPMHVIFITGIVAVPAYLRLILEPRPEARAAQSLPLQFIAIVIWFAFAASWVRYFSGNPFECFLVDHWYFGSYSWPHWLWPIMLGTLPFAFRIQALIRRRSAVILICMAMLAVQFHCIASAWQLCHLSNFVEPHESPVFSS